MLTCGTCDLCCRLLLVEEIQKPAHTPCKHLVQGEEDGGCCGLHAAKKGSGQPESCALFFCAWLSSQRLPGRYRLPPEMRPDRCGVVFGPIDEEDRRKLHVNVDPTRPDSWKADGPRRWLEYFIARGVEIMMYIGDRSVRFHKDAPTVKKSSQ